MPYGKKLKKKIFKKDEAKFTSREKCRYRVLENMYLYYTLTTKIHNAASQRDLFCFSFFMKERGKYRIYKKFKPKIKLFHLIFLSWRNAGKFYSKLTKKNTIKQILTLLHFINRSFHRGFFLSGNMLHHTAFYGIVRVYNKMCTFPYNEYMYSFGVVV